MQNIFFLFTYFKNIIFLLILILHKHGKIIGLMQNTLKKLKLKYENYRLFFKHIK